MKTYSVSIEGTTPLLLNRFTDEAQEAATSGSRLGAVGDKGSPKEQAEKKLYLGHDGATLIVPMTNLFRCLIDAGKFFKSGKSKVTTQKSSLLPACIEVDGLEIPIIYREGWQVDTRPVRIPSTGGRLLAHRPMFHDWRLDFTLRIDPDFIAPKLMREIVDAAGKRIGLGDFRPDCKGMFGKFVVTHWAEHEEKVAA